MMTTSVASTTLVRAAKVIVTAKKSSSVLVVCVALKISSLAERALVHVSRIGWSVMINSVSVCRHHVPTAKNVLMA